MSQENPNVLRVVAKLKELKIGGEVTHLASSARSAQEAADALGILVGQVASSIVFKLNEIFDYNVFCKDYYFEILQ